MTELTRRRALESDISRWLNERSSRRERQRQAHSCATNQALIALARKMPEKVIVLRLRSGTKRSTMTRWIDFAWGCMVASKVSTSRLTAAAGGVYEAGHFRRQAVTLIGRLPARSSGHRPRRPSPRGFIEGDRAASTSVYNAISHSSSDDGAGARYRWAYPRGLY
jgi:hypothetical protein